MVLTPSTAKLTGQTLSQPWHTGMLVVRGDLWGNCWCYLVPHFDLKSGEALTHRSTVGWACITVVKCLPPICNALHSILWHWKKKRDSWFYQESALSCSAMLLSLNQWKIFICNYWMEIFNRISCQKIPGSKQTTKILKC